MIEPLTPAEERLLRLLVVEGLSQPEAGRRLGATRSSINYRAMQVLRKTGARSMAQAAYFLTRAGMIADELDKAQLVTDAEIVLSMRCPECRQLTELTRGESRELIKKLDPRYPSRQESVTCRCGRGQFMVQARKIT